MTNVLRVLVVVVTSAISAVSFGQNLVVYEGTANVRSVLEPLGVLPFTAAPGDEFRFRATIDSAVEPSLNPDLVDGLGGLYYEGAIRDLAVWINGEPIPVPPTHWDPPEFNNIILVRNNTLNAGQPLDLVLLLWDQIANDGKKWQFIFSLEDNVEADLLSSSAIPTAVDWSQANGTGIGFNVYAFEGSGFDGLDMVVTGFEIEPQPSVSSLLQQLLTHSTGVGPGKSLANKVSLAQTYYAVPDIQAACAVLESFLHEVAAQRGKKLTAAQADALSGDAAVIMRDMACE